MNILVTGGAGYIGKIFIEKYHTKFNKIYVIDNLYDSFNEGFPNNVIFLENEFGNQLALDKVFSNKIECVFHFAAFAAIGESNSKLKQIDRLGSFEADDETGFAFKELKDIYDDLNRGF